jgi:uncharacterized protein DUF397
MRLFATKDMKYHSESNSSQNWIKSSYSMTNGNCIEVAGLSGEVIGVRDSKNPVGPILGFRPTEWDAFIRHVRNDAFDRR